MVMPRSRSSAFESITRSATSSLERKMPLWCSMASTSVVLPWSTCAMIAMLRILSFWVWCMRYRGELLFSHEGGHRLIPPGSSHPGVAGEGACPPQKCSRESRLFRPFGGKLAALISTFPLLCEFDFVPGNLARVAHHERVSIELHFCLEGDGIAIHLAIGDSDFVALEARGGACQGSTVGFEIVSNFAGLAPTARNLRDPLARYVGCHRKRGNKQGQDECSHWILLGVIFQ